MMKKSQMELRDKSVANAVLEDSAQSQGESFSPRPLIPLPLMSKRDKYATDKDTEELKTNKNWSRRSI